ncbi:F0F1 ATP synthase subunit gamma [candidate division WWE3 bacterium]|nr:F0F1 ATP synthase subunit gamma [candidate division WWE3 bacterium]
MAATKNILEEIQNLKNVRNMVLTYEEIAATRMQRVKTSVLINREFLASLYSIYQHVKYSYDREVKVPKYFKKTLSSKIIPRNGKTVSVFLSSNTGLYGDIIKDTFDLFVKSIQDKKTDIVVVGRVGQRLFDHVKKALNMTNYQYFELSDSSSNPEDFIDIISYVVDYEQVIVYHGQFQSILSQIPKEEYLTGDLPKSELKFVENAHYIFEPSLEKILSFFESEIMASIFEHSLHESSLSKYASRMINLDHAVSNISEKLKRAKFIEQSSRHRVVNKKQAELLSGMSLWG